MSSYSMSSVHKLREDAFIKLLFSKYALKFQYTSRMVLFRSRDTLLIKQKDLDFHSEYKINIDSSSR